MPVKLNKTVIRPALVYGAETWSTTKTQEMRLEVNEMRMLRWMCGVTKKDKIRKEHVRGSKKITEKRLTWYGHVKRREERLVLRRMADAPVTGKRPSERQQPRLS